MLITSKLGLQKPESTDPVSPAPFNNNSDILDNALLSTLQTLTAFEQTQVQSNLDVPSTSAVSTEIASKAIRYDIAQSGLTTAEKAQARSNLGLSGTQILNTTSITTTATSFNCAWDDYDFLSFAPGISGIPASGLFVPTSFFANTTSSIYIALPVFNASGTFAFQIRVYQNGSGKMYIYLGQSTSLTPRLRVWGING